MRSIGSRKTADDRRLRWTVAIGAEGIRGLAAREVQPAAEQEAGEQAEGVAAGEVGHERRAGVMVHGADDAAGDRAEEQPDQARAPRDLREEHARLLPAAGAS